MSEERMKTKRGHRRRGVWPLLLALALGLVLFAFTGSAAAIDVLDQQQTSTTGGFLMLNGPLEGAQTFTAGHTAPLAKISVHIGGWSAYLMRAEIWSSSGMLGATELTVTNYPTHWQDITFTPAPTLTAGTQYTIVLRWIGNPFTWTFANADPYAGGQALWSPDKDMCFKTYYEQADTTPPVFSGVPGNQTLEATGASGAVATWATPTANDTVDGSVSVTSDCAAGSVFPLGATTVTFTAVDAALNEATATFTITVADTTAPTVTAPLDITVNAASMAGAGVTFSASATDLVDGIIPANSIRYYKGYGTVSESEVFSGGTFLIGSTTVTVAATDSHANAGMATFAITVLGPEEMAANLAQQYQDWLVDGDLAGVGKKPTAAAGKADALGNMLEQVHAYIDAEDWAAALDQLEAALAKGILEKDLNLNPEAGLNRLQLARLGVNAGGWGKLARLSQIFKLEVADAGSIPTDYRGFVAAFLGLELLAAENGSFNPEAAVTRAQAASFLVRLLKQ